MSVKINKHNITMTRGDTLIVEISLTNRDGSTYIPTEFDRIRFALKENYDDFEPILLKEIPPETLTLRLESDETKQLAAPASYVYDIQITMGDGTVDTIVPRGRLTIREEVE